MVPTPMCNQGAMNSLCVLPHTFVCPQIVESLSTIYGLSILLKFIDTLDAKGEKFSIVQSEECNGSTINSVICFFTSRDPLGYGTPIFRVLL